MKYELDHQDIRDAVVRLCADFPGSYWQACDRDQAYPSEFVKALTEAGYLSALIPEQYGGLSLPISAAAAILEEIHRSGGNAAACHAQMYTMGTVLRHGSDEQKARYLPQIADGSLRLQAFGVTEPTSGTDTTALRCTARREGDTYFVNGQKIWTSRAEYSDLMVLLARTTARDKVEKKTDGLSVFLVDMREVRGKSLTIRPIRTMMNHATTEVFFDEMPVPAENLIGEEGKGFRYILSGMNAERILIAAECIGDAKWFIEKGVILCQRQGSVRPPHWPEPGHSVSHCARLCANALSRTDAARSDPLVRGRQQPGRRSKPCQAACSRCAMGSRRGVLADPWRLRFCRGI
jgi:acyl-CoA dehydrogenase